MSGFRPVRFVDVTIEGDFWRERLETVPIETPARRARSWMVGGAGWTAIGYFTAPAMKPAT